MMLKREFALLAVIAMIDIASCLKCHQCTSFEHSKCGDPFVYEPAREGELGKPKTMEFYNDCPDNGRNYTICRKIYQYVRGDERVIRSCGYEEYKNECYKTVLEEYNTYVCQCNGDGCNSAPHLAGPAKVTALVMAVAVAVFAAH